MKKYLAFLFFFLSALTFAPSAGAQQANYVVRGYVVTVSSTAAQCVAPSSSMQALYIENIGGVNNVYYDFSPNIASSSASPLLPAAGNGNKWWPPGSAPRNGLSCVTTSGSATVYVAVYSPQ